MSDARVMFAKVLRAELEDLREDIRVAEARHVERFNLCEITDYVFRENDALFRREAESVSRLLETVDAIDLSLYTSLDEMVSALDRIIKESVHDYEDPEAVYHFVSRKLKKVQKYVEGGDLP